MCRFTVAAVALLGMTSVAQATIIEGTFTGTLGGSELGSLPVDFNVGDQVTGKLQFDTNNFPNAYSSGVFRQWTGADPTAFFSVTDNGSSIFGSISVYSVVEINDVDSHLYAPGFLGGWSLRGGAPNIGQANIIRVFDYGLNIPYLINVNDPGSVSFSVTESNLFDPNTELGWLGDALVTDGGGYSVTVSLTSLSVNPVQAPEPATLALLGMGIAGLGVIRRRKPTA